MNIKGNMDDIESNVAQDLRNAEKTGVASVVPPRPPTPLGDKQQLLRNQQRAETEWGRNEQVAVRAELYREVQLFAHSVFLIVFVIVFGSRGVEVTGTLAILLGVLLVVAVLLLAFCCLWTMWLIYREEDRRLPFILWLKLAFPFSVDLQTISLGVILLFEMLAIGTFLTKCAKNWTVGRMVE